MPLKNYGVLAGHVQDKNYDKDESPHLHLLIKAGEELFDVSVNVQSKVFFSVEDRPGVPPNQVLYLIEDPYTHPTMDQLAKLETGFQIVAREAGGLAVDYIRGNFFDAAAMNPLPATAPGPDNDLFEKIGFYVQRALEEKDAVVYVFGEAWLKTETENARFKFKPDQGIHDVHMNQGNDPDHQRDDGVRQDGALFFHFPGTGRWVGVFLAFQAQCWHTDDVWGRAIKEHCPRPGQARGQIDGEVLIVGATVNPENEDKGHETVFLLNTTPKPIDLSGWRLVDKAKRKEPLQGKIEANDIRRIELSGGKCLLSNNGGIISLLDQKSLKVHGVSYTKGQARRQGRSILF